MVFDLKERGYWYVSPQGRSYYDLLAYFRYRGGLDP